MQNLTARAARSIFRHVNALAAPTGHALKVERVAARVKAKDLAAQMGVSGSRLSHLEREQYPSPEMVSRYRVALVQCQNLPHVSPSVTVA